MTLYAFRAVPLMFGPDYERPADPTDADYWTVYARDADDGPEGPEFALADTRDLTNALAWIAAKMDARVDVDVPIGEHVLTVAVEPIPTDWFVAEDLLYTGPTVSTVPDTGGTDTGHADAVASCPACIANGLVGCATEWYGGCGVLRCRTCLPMFDAHNNEIGAAR